MTKAFFEKMGVPVEIFYSYGATEAKVPELVDVVVDLTETGSTLRKNGLKIVDIIAESSTKLIANKKSWDDPEKRKDIKEIRTLLLAVIEARGKVLIVKVLRPQEIPKYVEQGYFDIGITGLDWVNKGDINILIPKLKALGAEDILELDISKIVH